MQTLDWQQNVVKRVAVGDLADRAAARFPNNIAVADGDFQLTFSEFNQYANRIAHALLRRTVEPNTRVALLSRNSWQFLVSYFACAKAGMIAVPLNTRLDYPLLRYCLEDSGAKILMMETTYAGAVPDLPTSLDVVWYRESALAPCPSTGTTFDQLLQEGDPGEVTVIVRDRDPVQLLYTSGTTGKP
ncbi:MAG: AMP-binding protein, partial [Firmicutes bacterium]|nr:AMP-binding protein [Bacillota bacterium]